MISRRFKKYTPFISAGLKISLSYRLDFICYRLGDILEAVVTYFLWILIHQMQLLLVDLVFNK